MIIGTNSSRKRRFEAVLALVFEHPLSFKERCHYFSIKLVYFDEFDMCDKETLGHFWLGPASNRHFLETEMITSYANERDSEAEKSNLFPSITDDKYIN